MSGVFGVKVAEPRRKPRWLDVVLRPDVSCPAGSPIYETEKGWGVRCAIEQSVLTALLDPSTVKHFCCGEYNLCTTWQHEKNWIEQGWLTNLLDDSRDERRARELMDGLVERAGETEITYFEHPE